MIALINTLPAVEHESAALARIKCTFSAYGKYPEIALFWEQTDKSGEIISLISLLDSNMTVWSRCADSELKEFISVSGAATVFAEADVASFLGIEGDRLCAAVTLSGTGNTEYTDNTDRLYEIFKKEFDISRNEFIADVSHRLRHGSAKCEIKENAAAFMQLGENCGYITGIVVENQNRSKGQGSALLGELLELKEKIKVYACCSEKILPFYLKNGFKEITSCVIGRI